MTTVTGIVTATKRLRNSREGNPRYEVKLLTSDKNPNYQTYQIAADTTLGFEVDGKEYANHPHIFGLNGHGQITHDMGRYE